MKRREPSWENGFIIDFEFICDQKSYLMEVGFMPDPMQPLLKSKLYVRVWEEGLSLFGCWVDSLREGRRPLLHISKSLRAMCIEYAEKVEKLKAFV